ncbi:Lrp/AsnC family transcriptional regulator [Stappia sp.]|uniref:Lrp/AsnC family transcriptional regulator n=1 Tax=Stappia sp. TaxID=1870903 RepID=UPI003D0E254B
MTDRPCDNLPDAAVSPLDRELIRLLSEDARRSNTELAGLLKVSRTTVQNRIARLVDLGVIERFTIKLGGKDHGGPPGGAAFFHMKLKRPFCRMVYEAVRGWPELTGAWSIAGGTDMTLLVQCSGLDRLEDLRDRLARHPEVEVVWTAMVLRQWSLKSSMNRDYEPGDGPDRLDLRLEEIAAGDRRQDIGDGLVQAR